MTGSEKADGYSRDVFVGLEASEVEIVIDLLAKELPWSVEWLFFLDPKRALNKAKDEEKRLRRNGYSPVYQLQQKIIEYSGEMEYQKHMIEDYPSYIDRLRPMVIDSIAATPLTENTINFFKEVILVEANDTAVTRASRHLLDAFNIPHETESEKQEYFLLLDGLRSENFEVKKKMIDTLDIRRLD